MEARLHRRAWRMLGALLLAAAPGASSPAALDPSGSPGRPAIAPGGQRDAHVLASWMHDSAARRPNRAPVADAGADMEVDEGGGVELNGAASFDPDGDALGFLWRQVGGARVHLGPGANVANPAFAAPGADGRPLVFELHVVDRHGHGSVDHVVVTVVSPTAPRPAMHVPAAPGEVSLARRAPR